MMKKLIRSFLAAALLLGMTAVGAEDSTAKPGTDAKDTAGAHAKRQLTPEQRKEAREKAQARLKDLREKKDKGTLTDSEKTQLERIEKRAKAAKESGPNRRKKDHAPAKE